MRLRHGSAFPAEVQSLLIILKCFNSRLRHPECGRITTAINSVKKKKNAGAKKCGREWDQSAAVYLQWSLKSEAGEEAAEEPVSQVIIYQPNC